MAIVIVRDLAEYFNIYTFHIFETPVYRGLQASHLKNTQKIAGTHNLWVKIWIMETAKRAWPQVKE